MLQAYLIIAAAIQLIFWLVPNFYVSAVAVSFIGFFLGPLFPAAIVASTKRLPQHLHVAAIGFAVASGAGGACALPFAVGAIAQAKGVQVLMPIVLAMFVANLGVWMWLPNIKQQGDEQTKRKRFSLKLSAMSSLLKRA